MGLIGLASVLAGSNRVEFIDLLAKGRNVTPDQSAGHGHKFDVDLLR